jgi:hypothetical protein
MNLYPFLLPAFTRLPGSIHNSIVPNSLFKIHKTN